MPRAHAVSRTLYPRDLISEHTPGEYVFVNQGNVVVARTGGDFDSGYLTIQAAHDAASAGDRILVAPGDYEETVTITKDNLTFVGAGARGSVSVAPGGNGIAWVIDGTTASGRVEEVEFHNIGGEGAGTGGGIHIKGNIRRIRAYECKFEGGAFAAKLESTAAGSVADVQFRDCEFAWTTTGVSILASGGGDPVTQLDFIECWWHNCVADGVKGTVVAAVNIHLHECRFDDLEDGTAPTGKYVDLQVAGTTGTLTGCYFPVAVNGAKVIVAATCVVLGCWFTGGANTAAPT